LASLRSARRLPAERQSLHKVAVSRCLLESPTAFVGMGNHRVWRNDDGPESSYPHARLPAEAVAVAHVPIRSADQLTRKIAIGWLAHLAAKRGNPDLVFHWREAYAELAAGKRFSSDDLVALAANYSVPKAEWAAPEPATWLDDRFLAPITLRYVHLAQADALAATLRFMERLASA
jgi:hypothetical protein